MNLKHYKQNNENFLVIVSKEWVLGFTNISKILYDRLRNFLNSIEYSIPVRVKITQEIILEYENEKINISRENIILKLNKTDSINFINTLYKLCMHILENY